MFIEMLEREEIGKNEENLEQLSWPRRCVKFLLHHAVSKKDGKTVRIEFNASRKGADANSLNDPKAAKFRSNARTVGRAPAIFVPNVT